MEALELRLALSGSPIWVSNTDDAGDGSLRDAIEEALQPLGVAVVIEATHLCMVMRGVQKQNSVTTTSSMSGPFMDNTHTRAEFMRLISSSD